MPPTAEEEAAGETLAGRTRDAVDNLRRRERALADAKRQEDREAIHRDASVYRLILTYTDDEAELVKAVLGDDPALATLDLCRSWAERTGWEPEPEPEEEPEPAEASAA